MYRQRLSAGSPPESLFGDMDRVGAVVSVLSDCVAFSGNSEAKNVRILDRNRRGLSATPEDSYIHRLIAVMFSYAFHCLFIHLIEVELIVC